MCLWEFIAIIGGLGIVACHFIAFGRPLLYIISVVDAAIRKKPLPHISKLCRPILLNLSEENGADWAYAVFMFAMATTFFFGLNCIHFGVYDIFDNCKVWNMAVAVVVSFYEWLFGGMLPYAFNGMLKKLNNRKR